MMSNNRKVFDDALDANDLNLPESIRDKLWQYLELIQSWNKVFNLTTITKPCDMVFLHIIDSLVVHPYLNGNRLLDVGSGAGLPGMALAITDESKQWTLLDKNSKKTRFLTQVVAELNLTNVTVIHNRCEEFHPTECFDSIISRAFGTINMFIQTTAHLLCKDGRLLAMKGKLPQDELSDLPHPFELDQVVRLNIKGVDVERHLVCLRKS